MHGLSQCQKVLVSSTISGFINLNSIEERANAIVDNDCMQLHLCNYSQPFVCKELHGESLWFWPNQIMIWTLGTSYIRLKEGNEKKGMDNLFKFDLWVFCPSLERQGRFTYCISFTVFMPKMEKVFVAIVEIINCIMFKHAYLTLLFPNNIWSLWIKLPFLHWGAPLFLLFTYGD